jgi:hypothetical protein
MKRSDSGHGVFDEIGKLVAEYDGENCAENQDASLLPAEFPDDQCQNSSIKRYPHKFH